MKFYCSKCGLKLKFKDRKIAYYDSRSGEPIYQKRYRCPKLIFLSFSTHSEKIVFRSRGLDGEYRNTVLSPMP